GTVEAETTAWLCASVRCLLRCLRALLKRRRDAFLNELRPRTLLTESSFDCGSTALDSTIEVWGTTVRFGRRDSTTLVGSEIFTAWPSSLSRSADTIAAIE